MPTDALAHRSSPKPVAWLWLVLAAALAAVLAWHGPIPQWPEYHAFADARAWLGLPNAANVLSNLPFALAGLWGLRRLAPLRASPSFRAWQGFCLALIATAAGSWTYHLAPANDVLVADRLPIALACATLLCAFGAERIDRRFGHALALSAAAIGAAASVFLWWWSERQGAGDLRAYLFVQFLPMLVVPATLLVDRHRAARPDAVAASAWWTVLALYATAKAVELADQPIFAALGGLSGHTLKHLLAAAGAAALIGALPRRR